MNLPQHPLYNKQSACQLLEWDHYYEGHKGLWTSNWRKPTKVEGTSYQRHRCCLCVYIPLIPFILNPDQLEMKSRIGPSVLCTFTWVLFVLIWDMHQSSSGWICVAGSEYSVCVCVCVCARAHAWLLVCMRVCQCACMESSFSMLLLGRAGDTELKQLPICGTEVSLGLRAYQSVRAD